jgi:septal ring factor EnvC (AmiA/AmiB activator)
MAADDVFKKQLKEVQTKLEKEMAALEKLQEEQRGKPDTGRRYAIQEAKNKLAPLQAEEGELLRTISRLNCGKQYTIE